MEDEATARIEEGALKVLLGTSVARGANRLRSGGRRGKINDMNGWENPEKGETPSNICMKGRKHVSVGSKRSPARYRRTQTSKNEGGKKYFLNHKARKQHIEFYRLHFSTVKQVVDEESGGGNLPQNYVSDKGVDPYLPESPDQKNLYKRLNLLQTLSDFYSIGVSSRELRRQAFLPPVNMTYNKARTKSITKIDPKEMDKTIVDISKAINDCHVRDQSTTGSTEFERVCCSLMDKGQDANWQGESEAQSSSSNSDGHAAFSTAPLLQSPRLHAKQDDDRGRPSQKLVDSLRGSLKEQLTVLRSGQDLQRQSLSFPLNSDRFVPLKRNPLRSEYKVNEKTVSSIPNTRKGKTLFISILGRNPLTKSLHDS